MKQDPLIKILLIVGGGYLAYRWAVSQGMIPDMLGIAGGVQATPAQPSPGMVSQPSSGVPASTSAAPPVTAPYTGGTTTGGAGSNTPPGGSGTPGSVKDQLWNAAKGVAIPNNGKLHYWEWNYFLPSNVAKPDPFAVPGWENTPLGRPPASEAEVMNTPLTIDQYWSMTAPVLGLSGIQGVNHWASQPIRYRVQ